MAVDAHEVGITIGEQDLPVAGSRPGSNGSTTGGAGLSASGLSPTSIARGAWSRPGYSVGAGVTATSI